MKHDAVFIDAFSTIHVGNGALLDNSYKLAKDHLNVKNIHVVSADTDTNKNRYESVISDIFSSYPKTKQKKLLWSMWYITNCVLSWIFISLKIPVKYWIASSRFKQIFKVIQKSEFVISISGETLNDYFAPQMYMRCLMFYLCIKLGKRFCVFPQSIGPIFRDTSVKMLRLFLGKAEVIFARDQISLDLANKIWKGCSVKVAYSPDVAVTQESSQPDIEQCTDAGKKIIGITLSNPPAEIAGGTDYVNKMIAAISAALDKNQYSIHLMPSNFKKHGISEDYNTCKYAMAKFVELGFSAKILPNEIIHPDEYQTIQKTLALFISSRMHVGILATSAAVPTIMLNTQHKIRGYMDNIEMGDFVIEYEGIEPNLPGLIKRSIADNELIRKQLKTQNAHMRKRLSDSFNKCFQTA